MASGRPTELPAYISLRYQESGVFSKLESQVASVTGIVRRDFEEMAGTVQNALARAVTMPRTAGGSLDLGVDQMREAVRAQQTLAVAMEETARAARRASDADGGHSVELRRTAEAAEALAIRERQAADAAQVHANVIDQVQAELSREASAIDTVIGSQRRLAGANDNAADSSGRHRAAMQNLSYQLQDVAIQAQMGTSWFTILAQQGGSIAAALSEMSAASGTAGQGITKAGDAAETAGVDIGGFGEQAIGVAEKVENTGTRMGRFAAFLSGPWGAGILMGVAVLGPLIASLADTGDEADRSASKIDKMTDALERLRQAQSRVSMEQLGYAQADVFEKQSSVNRLVAMRSRVANNVGLAGGLQTYDDSIQKARDELTAAQDLLKVSKMRAEVQARADAADRAAEAGKRQGKEDEREAKAAERAARAAEKHRKSLEDFGGQSLETIRRITEQFDEQPKAIDKAAQATRALDAIIADLSERKPLGFARMITEAQDAKRVIVESLVQPLRDMELSSERRLRIQGLIAQGHDDEAAGLQAVWALEDKLGNEAELRAKVQALTTAGRKEEAAALAQLLAQYPAMKSAAADLAEEDARRTRELERQRALFEAQLNVIQTARGGLTDLLSGRKVDFLGDLKQSLKDLHGARVADQLFGDVFAELEDQLRQRTPLGKATSRLTESVDTAGDKLDELATALEGATKRIGAVGTGSAGNPSLIDGNEVTVTRKRGGETSDKPEVTIARPSIVEMAMKTSAAMVQPFQASLNDVLGTRFGQMLGSTITGAIGGNLVAGTTGGILGGLKGLVDQTEIFGGANGKLSGKLGIGLDGAATGSMAAGIMKGLGLKTSSTGAQIGGAIGGLTGIPGGDIIGSIAGGLLGGLFKTNRTAGAVITNGSGYSVGGNDKGNYGTASGLGDSVLENLHGIVDKLGGTLGNFMVTIGTRGDEYRVNPNGNSLKIDQGAISFGDDAEAAIAYAVKNAIEDGAIKGMRASTLNILKAGKDLEAALTDALDWENVFKELRAYKDPLGAAMSDLNDEFARYIEIGKAAGATTQEMADLQELYGIKQAEAVKNFRDRVLGGLQGLLSDLTTGDNGLSLRDRRTAALDEYDDLKARVAAGDTTAYDDYADAAKALLDIERSLYGSQSEYFDRLAEITDLTKTRIDKETNVISMQDRDSPFDAAGAVNRSIQSQTDQTISRLDAVNENLGRAIARLDQIAANGGASSGGGARLSFASSF